MRKLLILTVCCLIASGASRQSTAAPASAWMLEQQSDYSGRQTIIVSPDGMRADTPDYTTVLIPPEYNATLYNHRTRKYFVTTGKHLSEKYKLKSEAVYQIVRGGSQKIAGLKAQQFFGDKVSSEKTKRRKLEFWVTQDLPVPAKAYRYWSAMSGIPNGYGLPLRVIKLRSGGTKTTIIDTLSCRRTSITGSTFKIPVGYKMVDDEMSIILGE